MLICLRPWLGNACSRFTNLKFDRGYDDFQVESPCSSYFSSTTLASTSPSSFSLAANPFYRLQLGLHSPAQARA